MLAWLIGLPLVVGTAVLAPLAARRWRRGVAVLAVTGGLLLVGAVALLLVAAAAGPASAAATAAAAGHLAEDRERERDLALSAGEGGA